MLCLQSSRSWIRNSQTFFKKQIKINNNSNSPPPIFSRVFGDYHQNFIYLKIPSLDPNATLYEIDFSTPYKEFISASCPAEPEENEIAFEFTNPMCKNKLYS